MSSDAIVILQVTEDIVKALDRLTDAIEESTGQSAGVAEQLGDVVSEIHKVNQKLSVR